MRFVTRNQTWNYKQLRVSDKVFFSSTSLLTPALACFLSKCAALK